MSDTFLDTTVLEVIETPRNANKRRCTSHTPQDNLSVSSKRMKLQDGSAPPAEVDWTTSAVVGYPSELVVLYDPPLITLETKLMKQIRQFDPNESTYHRLFSAARHVLLQVGPCACDLVWRSALEQHESHPPVNMNEDDPDVTIANIKRSVQDLVKNWTFSMPNFDLTSRSFNVTPKIARLVQILKSYQTLGNDFRGIIIVHKRAVALAIADLLRTSDSGLGFLRPFALTGQVLNPEAYVQNDLGHKFISGTYNLLVVTKSNEDLDIPTACLVIQYDLLESQYVAALRHASKSNSLLIHMAESGNEIHRSILTECTRLANENRLSRKDQGWFLPPQNHEDAFYSYDSESEDEDDGGSLKDPVTNRRIFPRDANRAMYHLAMRDTEKHPNVDICRIRRRRTEQGAYIYQCTVSLLINSSLRCFTGSPRSTPAGARRMACHHACVELFNAGLLDYRLFPQRYIASAIISQNPADEGNQTKTNKPRPSRLYLRKKPHFWHNSLSFVSNNTLYPVMITLSESPQEGLHAPILLLIRQPLPLIHDFKLYFSGIPAPLHFVWGAPLEVTENQLEMLHLYTLQVCRIIANKAFTCPLDKMTCFYAPLKSDWGALPQMQDNWDLPDIFDYICWESIGNTSRQWAVPLNRATVEDVESDVFDMVIQDRRIEFTRRYYVVKVRPDLSPLSKLDDSPREAAFSNMLEYCKSRRKETSSNLDENQPLVEVSRTLGVSNHLSPTFRHGSTSTKASAKYLIPELCAKLTIPASTYRTLLLIPSISRRIDDILIMKELNAHFFNHRIQEDLLLAAISTPSAGFEYDYERLEVLGDSFLKYLSSIYVFVTNPTSNEGALHTLRQLIISNKALLQSACSAGLPPFIQSKSFSYKSWQPPNFQISKEDTISKASESKHISYPQSPAPAETSTQKKDKTEAETSRKETADVQADLKNQKGVQNTQWLGNKAIADVVEAIIGAAYISGGRELALKTVKSLDIPVRNIVRWADFGRKAFAPPPRVTAKLREGSIAVIENIIGHKFAHPHLLAQALTHASIQGYESTCYERLEFLGDAILEFMVIRHIYNRDDKLSPGVLTLMKGAMVSNSALAAVCISAGLHKHLLFESFALANNIQNYTEQLKRKQDEEYKLAARENRNPGQFWLDIEPPKALSDVVESIIGAIYISDGFQPIGSELIFDNILKPFYDQHVTLKTLAHHPTKVILELFEAHGCQKFEIVKKEDVDQPAMTCCEVVIHDIILAAATDTTAAMASRRASTLGIDALEGDPGFLGRTCDCRNSTLARKSRKTEVDKILADLVEKDVE